MSDTAFRPLLDILLRAGSRTLWVTDEHLDALLLSVVAPHAGLTVMTNRVDGLHALQRRGIAAQLDDFNFDPWLAQPPNAVAYRVSKEKAIVHHVINEALRCLRPGGELWLSGGKNEGIRTYIDKASALANGSARVERHGDVWLGVLTRGETLGEPLDEQRYREWRQIDIGGDARAWSKPGIYGWQKIDAGSALLIAQLDAVWPQPPHSVFDLGCGYGYLAINAARHWPDAAITATDNNVAAFRACEKNMTPFGARANAVLADCGGGIEQRFDAVLCNPPFHQGFDIEADLTSRFLHGARRHLKKGGRALFVVNQFIPLERKAAAQFSVIREIARANGFKIIVLEP